MINKKGQEGIWLTFMAFAVVILAVVFAVVIPLMQPWWAEQTGKAELAQAEQNRQIAVKEAQAKRDSAVLLAEAEVTRAEGVAKANKIIGDSLRQNEDYLRYLWITDVAGANVDKTVVYIPTETNLPILEATRSLSSSIK
jgi:regulator of protease activity HflC (stomatin/prohibitin superfamily)